MSALIPACRLALGAAIALSLALSSTVSAAPPVGKPAPRFALRDREGALMSLSDMAYPGPARPRHPKRVVVLDFFRTDCKPCRNGLPKLVKLHKKLRSRGVQVVLVALLEDEEGEAKLDRFLARYPLPFPVLVDAYSNVARKYVATGDSVQIPALFVIDRNGVLRSRVGGVVDSKVLEKLQARIEELLK